MNQENTHYAKIEPAAATCQVFYRGNLILQSDEAVRLEEHYGDRTFAPVIYFPPATLDELETRSSDKSTHCPIKGDASYWHYADAENAIWSYLEPLDGVAPVRAHIAFDQSQGFEVKQLG